MSGSVDPNAILKAEIIVKGVQLNAAQAVAFYAAMKFTLENIVTPSRLDGLSQTGRMCNLLLERLGEVQALVENPCD